MCFVLLPIYILIAWTRFYIFKLCIFYNFWNDRIIVKDLCHFYCNIIVFLQDTAEKDESFLIISFMRSNGQKKLRLQPCPFPDLLTPFISLTTSLRGQTIRFHKGYHVLLYIPLCKKRMNEHYIYKSFVEFRLFQ